MLDWVQTYVTMADIFANFICVVLYYKQFKHFYGKLCFCLDNICSKCWTKLVAKKEQIDLEMMQKSIECHAESTTTQTDITCTVSTTPPEHSNMDKNKENATVEI